MGYKNGISLGLLIIAAGAFMFYPAASSRTFLLFLIALFIMGTGLAVLQTASNPYVVVIGPRESAAARISVLGIANKLAGFVAPIVLTVLVLSNMQDFTAEKIALMDEAQKYGIKFSCFTIANTVSLYGVDYYCFSFIGEIFSFTRN